MRPPGGLTTDMFNLPTISTFMSGQISFRESIFSTYARPYHCCYVSRKANKNYKFTHEEILAAFGDRVVDHENISGIFSAALGNYGYLIRSANLSEIIEMADYIQQME
jgi:hypothetical protein